MPLLALSLSFFALQMCWYAVRYLVFGNEGVPLPFEDRYLDYRGVVVLLVVSTVLAVLSQGAAIAMVVLVSVAIDGIEEQRGTGVLAWTVAAILVAGVAKALLMYGRRIISGRQALGIERDMREDLYGHLLRLSFGFYDRYQTGQLMSRATVDLQSVRFFLGFGLIFFFQHVLTVVSVTVVLFVVDWRLALIALWITPVLVLVAYRYSHVSHPILRDVQQQLGEVATVAEESIVGVHVVKAFAQEERRQEEFERASGSVFDATVRAVISGESFITPPGAFSALVSSAIAKVTGLTPELSTTGGTSDARFLSRICPVVEFGLCNATMHKLDEAVAVDDLHKLTAIYRGILMRAFL